MTFNEIDFEANFIHIVQEKTLQPQELPLLPEIKDAIMNYINNARPTVSDECRSQTFTCGNICGWDYITDTNEQISFWERNNKKNNEDG